MAIIIATENPVQIVSRVAGTNVTKRRFVKEAAGGTVNRCSVQGERANGVAASTESAGDPVSIKRGGTVIVEAGAAMSDLDKVMTDSSGRAITWVDNDSNVMLGRLTNGSSAGAAGDLCSVDLFSEDIDATA